MVIRKETFTNLHGCDDVVYAGKNVKSAGSGPTPRTLKQSTAGFRHRSPITVGENELNAKHGGPSLKMHRLHLLQLESHVIHQMHTRLIISVNAPIHFGPRQPSLTRFLHSAILENLHEFSGQSAPFASLGHIYGNCTDEEIDIAAVAIFANTHFSVRGGHNDPAPPREQ